MAKPCAADAPGRTRTLFILQLGRKRPAKGGSGVGVRHSRGSAFHRDQPAGRPRNPLVKNSFAGCWVFTPVEMEGVEPSTVRT